MHDVGWPYGRRDLYYAPDQIPEEFRQPYRRAGMRPGPRSCSSTGGINPTMCNAELEGGPRNGVMTALDDFLAEYDRPVRKVVVPDLLRSRDRGRRGAARAAARAARPRSTASRAARASRSCSRWRRPRACARRCGSTARSSAASDAAGAAASRYLELLKGALLDEHYLENEIRLKYLAQCVTNGEPAEPDRVRDPVRAQPGAYKQLLRRRRAGTPQRARRDERLPAVRDDRPARGSTTSSGASASSAPTRSPATSSSAAPAAAGPAIFMRGLPRRPRAA